MARFLLMNEIVRLLRRNRRNDPMPIPGRDDLGRPDGAFRGTPGLIRAFLKVQYPPDLLIAVTLIVGLNVIDAFFTMIILEQGGKEFNPVVQLAMDAWGDHFWIWKFVMVSSNVVLLCLCSRMKYVKAMIFGVCYLYVVLVMYQLVLLNLSSY
jgi:hypothetical protein